MYRVNIIACHKPWRYSSTHYIDDRDLFDKLKEQEDLMIGEVDLSSFHEFDEDNEDDTVEEYLYSRYVPETPFPIMLQGEVTFYTE